MSILWLKIKVTSNLFHCHLVTFLLQLVGEKPWGHEAWALQFLQTPLYKYLTSKIKREWESYFYVPESNFWSRKIFFSLDGDNLLCLIEGLYIPPRVLNFVELLAFENIDSRDCLKHELVFTINREASRPQYLSLGYKDLISTRERETITSIIPIQKTFLAIPLQCCWDGWRGHGGSKCIKCPSTAHLMSLYHCSNIRYTMSHLSHCALLINHARFWDGLWRPNSCN